MTRIPCPESTIADSFFPEAYEHTHNSPILLRDLPQLVRPVVEYIHELKPDAILAADRGARFLALSAMKSWKRRFPHDHFPTPDDKIHLARITSRDAEEEQIQVAISRALGASGLLNYRGHTGAQPKIVLIDDWVDQERTIIKFISCIESLGFPSDSVTFITLCGRFVEGVRHMVSDTGRTTNNSIWNAYEDEIGVTYDPHDPTIPIAQPNKYALGARTKLEDYIGMHYARFSAALALGEIEACSCIRSVE